MLFEISSVLVSCISGIIGVVVGAVITSTSARRTEIVKLLSEVYGDVATAYYRWIEDTSLGTLTTLLAAIERAKLVASDDILRRLDKLNEYVSSGTYSGEESLPVFEKFCVSAREELTNNIVKQTHQWYTNHHS